MINRNLFSRYSCIIWVLLIVMKSSVFAQAKDSTVFERYAGIYAGLGSNNKGIGLTAGYFFQDKYNLYILRVLCSSEFELFGVNPAEGILDLGLLYGRCYKKKFVNVSASAGIAAVWGTRRGAFISPGGFLSGDKYETDHFFTVGIPVQIQVFITPLRLLGIGLAGYANINQEMLVYGVLLCLQFGNVR